MTRKMHTKNKIRQQNLQLMCCPIGRPKTEVGVGSPKVNFATFWFSCARLTSLNSLKFYGSKQPISTCTWTK